MTFFRILKLIFVSLPELLELVKLIESEYRETERKKQLEKEIRAIRDAFKTKDAAALERAFTSRELRYKDIKD